MPKQKTELARELDDLTFENESLKRAVQRLASALASVGDTEVLQVSREFCGTCVQRFPRDGHGKRSVVSLWIDASDARQFLDLLTNAINTT